MLVYGDHCDVADPRERLFDLSRRLGVVGSRRAGLDRHAVVANALIEGGRLLQGVADSGVPPGKLDDWLHQLARCLVRSCDSAMAQLGPLPAVPDIDVPERVDLRLPEGFAFYAVYPEAYVAAARRLHLVGPPRVIGIRSIGTTLGAVVAATLDAPQTTSVRPFGDPFARQVDLPTDIIDNRSHYIIVDEGPGLSGSSFGAVADWLEAHGVELHRIAFLPSHAGDLGPRASERHRQRWHIAQRVAAEFNPGFLVERFGPLHHLSHGSPWEKLKYRTRGKHDRLLLKFAGLGAIGERKLVMARALADLGMAPEVIALVHGFLVQRWYDSGTKLGAREKPVGEIGRYIGARARLFPDRDGSGASIAELLTMCRRNIGVAMAGRDAVSIPNFDTAALQSCVQRMRTDNKMDREEWLRLPNGRLLKCDALDHHQDHDLIGCQDPAWDVAGAIVEFDLDHAETAAMVAAAEVRIDWRLLGFYRLAYAAFRLGRACLGTHMIEPDGSHARMNTAGERYARFINDLLLPAGGSDSALAQVD